MAVLRKKSSRGWRCLCIWTVSPSCFAGPWVCSSGLWFSPPKLSCLWQGSFGSSMPTIQFSRASLCHTLSYFYTWKSTGGQHGGCLSLWLSGTWWYCGKGLTVTFCRNEHKSFFFHKGGEMENRAIVVLMRGYQLCAAETMTWKLCDLSKPGCIGHRWSPQCPCGS